MTWGWWSASISWKYQSAAVCTYEKCGCTPYGSAGLTPKIDSRCLHERKVGHWRWLKQLFEKLHLFVAIMIFLGAAKLMAGCEYVFDGAQFGLFVDCPCRPFVCPENLVHHSRTMCFLGEPSGRYSLYITSLLDLLLEYAHSLWTWFWYTTSLCAVSPRPPSPCNQTQFLGCYVNQVSATHLGPGASMDLSRPRENVTKAPAT